MSPGQKCWMGGFGGRVGQGLACTRQGHVPTTRARDETLRRGNVGSTEALSGKLAVVRGGNRCDRAGVGTGLPYLPPSDRTALHARTGIKRDRDQYPAGRPMRN